jgi:preprotein translocase subunit SecD
MKTLRWRLIAVVLLFVGSVGYLFPRNVTVRRPNADGIFRDTVERRVPLKLGLDLAGGMRLLLEVDDSKQAIAEKDKADAIDRALKTVRTRVDQFGVSEPVIQKQGDQRIILELPGLHEQERAINVVREQAFLEFKIVDETQALERTLPRLDAVVKDRGLAVASAGAPVVSRDAPAPRGLQGLLPTDSGQADSARGRADSARADSATLSGGGAFSNLLQQGGMPGEFYVKLADVPTLTRFLADSAVRAALPPAKSILWGSDSASIAGAWYRALYVTDARAIMTGEHIETAQPNTSPLEGTIVQFKLDNVGGRRFRSETGKHIQDYMAIVLDNRVMGRPPVIQGAIGRDGQITMGGKDLAAAQDLALVLRAGALPVPLRVAEVRSIGPSLGQDSIDKGMRAGVLGIALVIIIMVAYYRFSGVLSVVGLIFYAATTLAFLAFFDAALTLPGIAGFVLSIGMAVDANFLQFERIREELDRGKTTRTAVEEGFKNSFSAIIDTHVVTALTGAVLYQYGTGPVQGFAVTLVAGVVSSMVSSVFVVRTLFLVWLARSRGNQPLSI